MTNIRTATWSNVGIDISKAASVQEALKISGLDYTVIKEPVFLGNGTPIPGAFCTKREETDETYGVVGSQFEIIQNEEGFDFINSMVPEGLKFLKAGENRKFTYIIAQLPEFELMGDKISPHVIFQNSHSGSTTLKATITPLRIVCENQFNLTFRKAANKVSLRHTKSIRDRLHTAQEVLVSSNEYLNELQKQAILMAQAKVSKKQVDSLLDDIFEISEEYSPVKIRGIEEKRSDFLAAYNHDDNQNFVGTQWGLINAYTDYVTHRPLKKETHQALENRFIKTTLKGTMNDFLRTVSKMS